MVERHNRTDAEGCSSIIIRKMQNEETENVLGEQQDIKPLSEKVFCFALGGEYGLVTRAHVIGAQQHLLKNKGWFAWCTRDAI